MQHDSCVVATLSICTRYYCDVHVIYISSSNSMLSSLSYDAYKSNSRHVPRLDVARSCCCGICVPGRTAMFHRDDMVANSTVILCAVYEQHRFKPVHITRCVFKFFDGTCVPSSFGLPRKGLSSCGGDRGCSNSE